MSLHITGATGQLGRLIIEELLKKVSAKDVVACVRRPEKAADLSARGVVLRYADYNDFESMKKAFAGAEKLLFISSPDLDDARRIVQHAHAALAAREAGVKHILYTGFAFAEKSKMPFASLHLASEYAVRTTGIPFTFLRNALYTDEAFVNGTLKAAVSSGELRSNCRRAKINSVSRADLARAAAAALTGAGRENRTYNLVSDRLWDYEELARALSAVAGKKIVFRPVSFEEEKQYLTGLGLSEGAAGFTALMYERVAEGEAAARSNDLASLIGESESLRRVVERALGS